MRLPRDWLGPRDWLEPREELVPLGRSAAAPPAGTDAAPVAQPPDRTEPSQDADAFWSESSAAIQDAVQAPESGGDWSADGGENASAGRACGRAALRGGVALTGLRGRRRRPRRAALPVGVVALLCVAGLYGVLQSQGSTSTSRRLVLAERQLPGSSAAAHSTNLVGHHSRPGPGSVRVKAIWRERASSHALATHAAAIRTRPSESRPAPAAPIATQSVEVSRPVSAPPPTAQASRPAAEVASGGGAPSSPASGPVGAGAPFGPGHPG